MNNKGLIPLWGIIVIGIFALGLLQSGMAKR